MQVAHNCLWVQFPPSASSCQILLKLGSSSNTKGLNIVPINVWMIPYIFLLCFYWFIIGIDVCFFSRNLEDRWEITRNTVSPEWERWLNKGKKVTGVVAALKHKKIYLMFHIYKIAFVFIDSIIFFNHFLTCLKYNNISFKTQRLLWWAIIQNIYLILNLHIHFQSEQNQHELSTAAQCWNTATTEKRNIWNISSWH